MSTRSSHPTVLPPEQQAIRNKCYHPTGTFIEFRKEAVEQSIPDRFEEQVRRYPNRLALKSQGQELTYDQLNRAANRLAQSILAERGESLEPVAVLFDHGSQMVVALLGVMKARKVFVPIDASNPNNRISGILEDSQASLIVTGSPNLSLASEPAQEGCKVVNIDAIDESLSDGNPGLAITPDDFAAILYTSGSTGDPKGVFHSHRSLLHMTMNYTNDPHICQEDRVCLAISITRIGGVWQTLVALLNGAALFPFDVRHEGVTKLANWLAQEELTTVLFAPSVFRQLVTTLTGAGNFQNLRLLHISGETVYATDFELYRKYFPEHCIFTSGLGTTEIIPASLIFGDKTTKITGRTVPVGYPVEGVEIFLLDDAGEDVGDGEAGEIAVKSRYLAQGYWNDPGLTRIKFLQDRDGKDERIYLTGDLGRILPEGCLIHLGRKDFQVKIRGYKVILGEVEAALCEIDEINEAAVVDRMDGLGNSRLVAYVTTATQPAPSISELRRALSQKLLDYMVPSTFVISDRLPLLPRGKVNRLALAAPTKDRPNLESPFVAPRTPVEEQLANIWVDVLDLDEIGVYDDFLELGGDSLRAGQVISRVINTFRVELALSILFEAATVADMAVIIFQNQAKVTEQEELDRMLEELDALTDEEAKRLICDNGESTMVSAE